MSLQLINQHSNHIKEICSYLEEIAYQKRILISGFQRECKKRKIVEKYVIKESLHLREDEKCAPGCNEIENEYMIASKLTNEFILNPFNYQKQYKGGCAIEFPRASCDSFYYFIERSQKEKKFAYTLQDVRNLLKSIASALYYLHDGENIAHNDIKLENFLCFLPEDNNQSPVFMLTDFGFAYEITNNKSNQLEYLSQSSSSSTELPLENQQSLDITPRWKSRVKRYLSPELITSINSNSLTMGKEKGSDIISLGFSIYTLIFFDTMVNNQEKEYSFSKKYQRIQQEGVQFLQTLNCKIVNTEPEKKDQLFDLILKMIHRDPSQRIDACGILNHPWIN